MTRSIDVIGLANARDLGGLERRDGTVTPSGAFIRSERLDLVDERGWDALRDAGVRTVIDLRRPDERSGVVPVDLDVVHVDLDGDETAFWAPYEADGRWCTPLYYAAHLRELPHRLAAVVNAIAGAADGAILFHCSAGWDRTGLVAAVLLRALDVTADAAVDDYLASFANADAMAALHERSFEVEGRHAVLDRFGHTAESAFREMYDVLDLDAWFVDARIDVTTRAALASWRGAAAHHRNDASHAG